MARRVSSAFALAVGAALLCAPVAVATPAPQIRLVLGGAEYAWVERLSPLTSLPVVRRYLTPNRDIGAGFFPGSTGVLIDYPASLFAFGTAREHIEIGADNLDAAIKARPGPLAVVGQSEGAVVLDVERARLQQDPTAPPADQLQFVLFHSPTRGFASTLFPPGTRIPFVDITVGPPVESRYDTALVIHEYDFWGDFPDRPWNLLALLNAVAGTTFVHLSTDDVPGDIAPENVTTVMNSQGATDTTYFVPTPTLPLTEVFRVIGVPAPAVDALDSVLRPVIDAGYSRNDGPDDPRPYLDNGRLVSRAGPATTAPAAAAPRRLAAPPESRHDADSGYLKRPDTTRPEKSSARRR